MFGRGFSTVRGRWAIPVVLSSGRPKKRREPVVEPVVEPDPTVPTVFPTRFTTIVSPIGSPVPLLAERCTRCLEDLLEGGENCCRPFTGLSVNSSEGSIKNLQLAVDIFEASLDNT